MKGAIGPASAGTYILYANPIAAMAPASNLRAATPVDLLPNPTQDKPAGDKTNTIVSPLLGDFLDLLRKESPGGDT